MEFEDQSSLMQALEFNGAVSFTSVLFKTKKLPTLVENGLHCDDYKNKKLPYICPSLHE